METHPSLSLANIGFSILCFLQIISDLILTHQFTHQFLQRGFPISCVLMFADLQYQYVFLCEVYKIFQFLNIISILSSRFSMCSQPVCI